MKGSRLARICRPTFFNKKYAISNEIAYFFICAIFLSMKTNTQNECAAFKCGGHTVIIVKLCLPCPEGDTPLEERVRRFYGRVREAYFGSARALADRRGVEIWEAHRRPLVFSVICSEKEEKSRKSRYGYAFLRTESLSGMKSGAKKRTEEDRFFEGSGPV